MKITNTKGSLATETKRFYLPAELSSTCPSCGNKVTFEYYLSYPYFNANNTVHFACGAEIGDDYCEGEWEEVIYLQLKVLPKK